ncbi:MAG: hypothetical protein UZ17_ACD001001859 [Acidobacteria bacterium OLB17]|nr:MAG: hypothetical protein UZ17_ACD001001859 [Acidobacteria bacterium OLB17]MCZ2391967.1 hypothetical protein [Acidobacteriota bacterium]
MATVFENDEQLKDALKSAIVEVLQERKDLIRAVFDEIIEDIALSRAIDEGISSPKVSREQVFELLETTN